MTVADTAFADARGAVPVWDDVVVGAGTSGCVLAARLSQDPYRRVLLLEAGPDPAVGALPNQLGIPVVTGFNWELSASMGADADSRPSPYPLGRVLGGTAAVNGAIALRGLPGDFHAWAAAGNPAWAWRQVEPAFAALESDRDAKGPGHGTDGPVPVIRARPHELGPLAEAFVRAGRQVGLPQIEDFNAGPVSGVGPIPVNGAAGRRQSTADVCLAPVRDRPNLAVWDGCHVDRVLLDGDRADGVAMLRDGRPVRVRAERIVLAAGGIGTPVILQRSGIGDPAALAAAGIEARVDSPGVGRNLIDHPAVPVWVLPNPGACTPGEPWYQVMARAATPASADPDFAVVLAANIETVTLPEAGGAMGGRLAAMVSSMLLDPESRGTVAVGGPDPLAAPVIRLGLLTEPRDVTRLMHAMRVGWSVIRSEAFSCHAKQVMVWTDRMVGEDALLRRMLPRWSVPLFHAAGTARMGPATLPGSVVDERCQVHGVDGLAVCDASVMPGPVSAPPALTCVLLAERAAALWASA
jgi:choline dehydrogenase